MLERQTTGLRFTVLTEGNLNSLGSFSVDLEFVVCSFSQERRQDKLYVLYAISLRLGARFRWISTELLWQLTSLHDSAVLHGSFTS